MAINQQKTQLAHRSVVLVASATALSLLGDQALYAVLPTCYQKLGLLSIHVGILLSANRWIRMLTNHLAERLIHRVNPTALLVSAMVLGAGVTGIYGLFPGFPVLLAARMLWGLCWSVIRQVGIMTSVDVSPQAYAARTMGFYSSLSRVGSILGMLAGAYLFDLLGSDLPGFKYTFWILAAAMLLAVVPGATARKSLDQRHSEFRRPRGANETNRIRALLVCAFVIGCVGPGVIESTLGYALKRKLGDSVSIAQIIIGIATLNAVILSFRHAINLLGAPLLGHLADRIGHQKGVFIFFCITTVILAAAAVASSVWMLICLVLLFFICATCLGVVLATEAGGSGSRAFAWYATAADFGAATGPLLAWTALQFYGLPWVSFAIGAGFYVIGAVAAASRLRRPKATPTG